MIKSIIYSKNNKIVGFSISGHANYADYGNDIVCSAISMLAINTANAIEQFTNDEFDLDINDDGYLSIIITSDISKESEVLLKALELGITQVKEQYGNEYIYVETEEV